MIKKQKRDAVVSSPNRIRRNRNINVILTKIEDPNMKIEHNPKGHKNIESMISLT
jgi:hypothetical protein